MAIDAGESYEKKFEALPGYVYPDVTTTFWDCKAPVATRAASTVSLVQMVLSQDVNPILAVTDAWCVEYDKPGICNISAGSAFLGPLRKAFAFSSVAKIARNTSALP